MLTCLILQEAIETTLLNLDYQFLMLLNSFFKILNHENLEAHKSRYDIEFDIHHEVFKGHFPGYPIVPGVFLTQIIHELAEIYSGCKLLIKQSKKIKFVSPVLPEKGNKIIIYLDVQNITQEYSVNATAYFLDTPCLKFNAKLIAEL